MSYKPKDRRPISARNLRVSGLAVKILVNTGISANGVSILSLVFGIGAGLSFWLTSNVDPPHTWWILAAIFILLRLIANMLDGMVAIEKGESSPLGELFNEVPDRISDVVTFIGAGFAAGSAPFPGFTAAILSLLVAYTRTLGNYMGVFGLFMGPMNKQQRMFTLIAVSIYCFLRPVSQETFPVLTWCLWAINAGCVITIARRLHTIARKVGS